MRGGRLQSRIRRGRPAPAHCRMIWSRPQLASSPGWTTGGGTAALNLAAQDVRSRLQAQATALQQCTREFLVTRAVVRVSFLVLDFFPWGRVSAPTRCSPRVPRRVLSRWLGTSLKTRFANLLASSSCLQDYHNLHAATFNSQVREADKRATDLKESRRECFCLSSHVGAHQRTHWV